MKQIFDGIWSVFKKSGPDRADLVDVLEQIPVFEGMNRFELNLISNILHERNYEKEELIFREHEAGNGMYIIQKGVVRICGEREDGETVLYAELGEGQFFGELALVDGAPRSATAIAGNEAVLFGFFKPDLLDLIESKPVVGSKILWNLTGVLASRLRNTNDKVIQFQRSSES